jgi:hypothetical protein
MEMSLLLVAIASVSKEIARSLITATFKAPRTKQPALKERLPVLPSKFLPKPLSGRIYTNYPLSVLVLIDTPVERITYVGELAWIIAKAYQKIYREEDKTSSIKAGKAKPGMYNRNKTNGTYGIWGHDFKDLYLEHISIYDNGNIIIGIGS